MTELPAIEINLFSDAYKTLKSVFADAKALLNIPGEEREKYRRALDETFTLLDSGILLVYSRLGDILIAARQDNSDGGRNHLVKQLAALGNVEAWETLNRDVRLCRNLRETSREMEGLFRRLRGKLSVQDQAGLELLIRALLEGEGRLADWIGLKLQSLSALTDKAKSNPDQVIKVLENTREALRTERMKLIRLQTEMYDLI